MIKLAQAFKDNQKRFKQIRGHYFQTLPCNCASCSPNGPTNPTIEEKNGACAMGVLVAVALGTKDLRTLKSHNPKVVKEFFPCLNRKERCPVVGCEAVSENGTDLWTLIVHLNDGHDQTFDQIEAFLESLPEECPVT